MPVFYSRKPWNTEEKALFSTEPVRSWEKPNGQKVIYYRGVPHSEGWEKPRFIVGILSAKENLTISAIVAGEDLL